MRPSRLASSRRDGVVVKAYALQSVELKFISLVESSQKTFKNDIHSFPAWRSAFKRCCEEEADKLACCVLGKTLNETSHLYVEDRWPSFPPRRGLVEGWASDCKNKCHVIAMQIRNYQLWRPLIGKRRKTTTSRLPNNL